MAQTEFTLVSSVRELGDGSVLVTDRMEPRLVLVQWGSSEATAIGRHGGGPGEYQGAVRLYALAGDSTLLTDSYNNRWSILYGAHFVGTLSEHRPLNRLLWGKLVGSDTLGHVLGVQGYAVPDHAPVTYSRADSVVVLLADWASERVDTVARIGGVGFQGQRILPPRGDRPMTILVNTPLSAADEVALFPDGWIAVARRDRYRVDWRAPNGDWTWGPPLPFTAVRVTDREKCAAMAGRGYAAGRCDPSLLDGWPEVVPPFLSRRGALLAAPNGHLVIARTPTAASPEHHYDVVDRAGRLVGTITLGVNEKLIGFGTNAVYVIVTDEWDLQTLQRHPWP